ncbi:hypothetical protein K144316041_p20080 (plasmid) [Clostridium tetani]|uniref:BRO family protein n=1 Tax=Clostridium tetani TaxID=1513 RepID=UPI0029559807|nr:BRO family protein [Clostridium tetani]BDR74169.1 hypothetical protein K144316041_p20080 [Clostridium tetani]
MATATLNINVIKEGKELEVLTREDVNFDFDGTVLFNGKQVGEILSYARPTKAIIDRTRESQRFLIKNSVILKQDFRNLNNAGGVFVTEKGIMKLIITSNMPKAEEFEDKVWEIVTQVQQTGKYDVVENKIQQIEDNRERELSLGLYQLKQVLKVNPNDMLTTLAYNNMQQELTTYKQNKKLEEVDKKIKAIENNQENQKKRLESIVAIGDRVQFTNEVNRVSRATGAKHAEIYNLTYLKLKNLYGIDLNVRTKNKRQELQNRRLDKRLKLYAPSTLKQKVNNLVLADEECLWNELGRSLYAVEQDLLNN